MLYYRMKETRGLSALTRQLKLKEVPIMAYVINDECISCGACVSGCPVEAISEGASHMEINADVCVDCGACAGTCPVGAPNPQ